MHMHGWGKRPAYMENGRIEVIRNAQWKKRKEKKEMHNGRGRRKKQHSESYIKNGGGPPQQSVVKIPFLQRGVGEDKGSIPGPGARISHAAEYRQIKNKSVKPEEEEEEEE